MTNNTISTLQLDVTITEPVVNNTMKQAWIIRYEAAERFNCKVSEISMSECLKQAHAANTLPVPAANWEVCEALSDMFHVSSGYCIAAIAVLLVVFICISAMGIKPHAALCHISYFLCGYSLVALILSFVFGGYSAKPLSHYEHYAG